MTAEEVRALVEEVRARDSVTGAVLTILLDKLVAIDRQVKELETPEKYFAPSP